MLRPYDELQKNLHLLYEEDYYAFLAPIARACYTRNLQMGNQK
jgi:hypothetical protein